MCCVVPDYSDVEYYQVKLSSTEDRAKEKAQWTHDHNSSFAHAMKQARMKMTFSLCFNGLRVNLRQDFRRDFKNLQEGRGGKGLEWDPITPLPPVTEPKEESKKRMSRRRERKQNGAADFGVSIQGAILYD